MRLAQIAFEQLALRQVGVHRRVVDAGAIAAFVLGAIERHVGIAHHVGGAAAGILVDDRDADAGADQDVVAADHVGRADRRDDALGHALHIGDIGRAGADDGEFVAAEPPDQILRSQQDPTAAR